MHSEFTTSGKQTMIFFFFKIKWEKLTLKKQAGYFLVVMVVQIAIDESGHRKQSGKLDKKHSPPKKNIWGYQRVCSADIVAWSKNEAQCS